MTDFPKHDWLDPQFATSWTASADELNPVRQQQLDLLLALLRRQSPGTVLDLGVGSGLVAEMVLASLPGSRLIGVDSSSAMLELAGGRLDRLADRVTLLQDDLETVVLSDRIVSPVGAAIAVQALHNLDPDAHHRLLLSAADVLAPGGTLIVVDRFAVAPELFDVFQVVWDRLGMDEGAGPEEHASMLDGYGDHPVSLFTELQWLEEAGLAPACIQLLGNRAVVVGRRA